VQARLAAILLTAMFASFTPLVHVPPAPGRSASHMNWSENALNIALTGAAWSWRTRWRGRGASGATLKARFPRPARGALLVEGDFRTLARTTLVIAQGRLDFGAANGFQKQLEEALAGAGSAPRR